MYNYSVIIPHKNCPDLLSRCINSIPNREDIEVIVVDDSSCDLDSIKLVESGYKHANKRFVYTSEKQGAGYARNVGMEKASGIWCIFADADDFFTKNAFDVFDNYLKTDNDIIYFFHDSVYSDTLEPCHRFEARNELIKSYLGNNTEHNLDFLRYQDVVPWAKLFKKSLIDNHDIKFDEVPASNDVMFVVKAASMAKNIFVSNEKVYTSTYRRGSITRINNKENDFSRYNVSLKYNSYLKSIGITRIRRRVFSYVLLAGRTFGLKEGIKYLKEAHKQKQNIFTGLMPTRDEIFSKLVSLKNKDTYSG